MPVNEEDYEDELEQFRDEMELIASAYYHGSISLDEFRDKMQTLIKSYYITLMLLGLGDTPTPNDLQDVEFYIEATYDLLDDLIATASEEEGLSENYLKWRAGLFAFARHVYVRYTVPEDVFLLMPVFPGVDCLGDGACGCSLVISESDEGVEVEWVLGQTEHCAVCLDAAMGSPYVFSWQDILAEL